MQLVHIKAALTWIVFQDRQSKYFVGTCEELKISSQGETLGKLMENIDDSLDALMRDLAIRRELDNFLKRHKWKLEGKPPDKPSEARFEVPYNIERRHQNDFQGVLG